MADDDAMAPDHLQFDVLRLEELTREVDPREIPGEPEYLRAAGPFTSQYLEVWETYEVRAMHTRALEQPRFPDPDADAALRRRLDEMPMVPALYALGANAAVVQDLIDGRWQAMRAARKDGATWEQIGRALRITKQGAQDFYKRWEADPDAPPAEPDREPTDDEYTAVE
ncbi:hypothetical protein [Promicromonospora sukumoe]|uniref:Uncharacterized protein n=1 Tax=Promicromonospora sukumoe TaxID=88382 RepID=A0A7W3J533_9MICO|nr:hypothetical protein [Promicromonospora sukumoe]MBA8806375.1 hypothetical protein [Promicromonospora sukumoe]